MRSPLVLACRRCYCGEDQSRRRDRGRYFCLCGICMSKRASEAGDAWRDSIRGLGVVCVNT
jgi:hypothetical protein